MSAWSARRPCVADVLTLGNALCGVAAILVVSGAEPFDALTMARRFQAAALLLLCGTLLDVLDGAAARRWGGTPMGGPLDSLADAITFGVAPVVAVEAYARSGASTMEQLLVVGGALVYAAAALVRLADFMSAQQDDHAFVGLPTTSACVAAVYLGFLSPPPALLAVGLVALAVMMVSPVAYPTGMGVLALCLAGWVLGFVGIVGLVDVRLTGLVSILTIVVFVPLTMYVRARSVSESAA